MMCLGDRVLMENGLDMVVWCCCYGGGGEGRRIGWWCWLCSLSRSPSMSSPLHGTLECSDPG